MLRLASVLLVACSLTPFALAAPGEQVASGSLLVGVGPAGPTDAATFLVGDAAPAAGVEAARIALDRVAAGGERVDLAWTSDAGASLQVRFYDAGFAYLPHEGCAAIGALAPRAGSQSCLAPAGAAHAVVSVAYGAAADFTFRYAHGA